MGYYDSDGDLILSESEDEETTINHYSELNNNFFVVLCIDIGINNMGMAALIYDKITYIFKEVVGIDLVDITVFQHKEGNDCSLKHTRTFTDWMEHVFQFYNEVFDNVDKIIIERQPPFGFVAAEQLIYSKYRDKCDLISPNSVHKHFNMTRLSYEERKIKSVECAIKNITNINIIHEFNSLTRQHDVADAICMGIFWIFKQHSKYLEEQNIYRLANIRLEEERNFKVKNKGVTVDEYLKQFRWVKPIN